MAHDRVTVEFARARRLAMRYNAQLH